MSERVAFGLITTIEVPTSLVAKGSCVHEKELLVATHELVNEEKQEEKVVYHLVDAQGNITRKEEAKGMSPIFFTNPTGKAYVALHVEEGGVEQVKLSSLDGQQSLLITTPLRGNFIGATATSAIFYYEDIWDEKQLDVMTVVHFEGDRMVGVESIEIKGPKNNKISVSKGEIHIITENEEGWLHRQIDETGATLKSRVLDFDFPFVHEALGLSFSSSSYLLCEENGEIGLVEITAAGEGMYAELFDLGDEFFGTWIPQVLDQDTRAIQFTTEFGNGWLVVRADQLVELFYNKHKRGYVNLITEEVLSIDTNELVLSGINALSADKLGVVFHPRTTRKAPYQKVFVLQHQL